MNVLSKYLFAITLGIGLWSHAPQAKAQGPSSLTDSIHQAIDRSVAFLEAYSSLDPDAYIIYHYLAAKFELPRLTPTAAYFDSLKRSSRFYLELEPFLRIVRPEPFQARFLAATGNLDDITAAGVWYDRLRPKKELQRRITAMDFSDPYNITHAHLAVALAEQYFGAKVKPALKTKLLFAMDTLIAQPAFCDVHIEAVALRQFGDPQYLAPVAAIRRVLAQQLPSGGWMYCAATKPEESQHTTVLALWALLGYRLLDRPSTDHPFLHIK